MSSLLLPVLPLFLIFLTSASVPVIAFDLTSLLAALGGGTLPPKLKDCPSYCECSRERAEEIMMRYVDLYLPHMGVHMNGDLEQQARSTISFMTLWLGHMAKVTCQLPANTVANITDLLQTSSLSFKALTVRCEQGASLVWDLIHLNAFVNVLNISGCKLELAKGENSLPVPINLWVLQLESVPAKAAQLLDLGAATQLLAFSWTQSSLESLPQHWASANLHSAMYISLARNNLRSYHCQLRVTGLTALNLDHNCLTQMPECVLNGSRYTNFLSMRHNKLRNLNNVLVPAASSHLQMPPAPDSNFTDTDTIPKPLPGDVIPQLHYLDLSYNQLESLQPIRKFHILTAIDLSHNRISSMHTETFSVHPYLSWLNLSHNWLTVVPDGALINLVMMQSLDLSNNRLVTFDFDQSPLSSKLVDLDLRYNRLAYPPFSDTGFVAPRLSRIRAAHNPFVCNCNLNPFLRLMAAFNSSNSSDWFTLGYWDSFENDATMLRQPYMDSSLFTCNSPPDLQGTPLLQLPFTRSCRLLSSCPSGCLCQLVREGLKSVLVDCSNRPNVTDLPLEVPVVRDASLVLLFNRSGLQRLEHRPYLRYITELHAGYSKVGFVTPGAIQAMENISVLSLDNNQLRSLPVMTKDVLLTSITNISLSGNPWTCGCHDLWMPAWLQTHSPAVYDMNNTRCRWSGEMVTQLNGDDLNCGVFNYLPLVMALTILLGLTALTASLLVKYRLEVLVYLYTRFNVRPFDMYRYNHARPVLFDVFVSFSQHDYQWVSDQLVDRLENREKPYKLCIHLRDFPAGAPIAESVAWAVTNSRCTLLVLTKHFMASEWCRHELRAAHARLLKDRTAKLLVVVHGPLDARSLDRELLAYLRTHTYLRTEDRWFWDKLEYALPRAAAHALNYIVPATLRAQPEHLHPPVPMMDIDLMPAAMAAGDVSPKRGSADRACLNIPL